MWDGELHFGLPWRSVNGWRGPLPADCRVLHDDLRDLIITNLGDGWRAEKGDDRKHENWFHLLALPSSVQPLHSLMKMPRPITTIAGQRLAMTVAAAARSKKV